MYMYIRTIYMHMYMYMYILLHVHVHVYNVAAVQCGIHVYLLRLHCTLYICSTHTTLWYVLLVHSLFEEDISAINTMIEAAAPQPAQGEFWCMCMYTIICTLYLIFIHVVRI